MKLPSQETLASTLHNPCYFLSMIPFKNNHLLHRAIPKSKYCTLFVLATLLSSCAAWDQLLCAPHNKKAEEPFPESELTTCISSDTSWANHPVFCIGTDRSNPPVILLHELPGLSPKTLQYAKTLSKDFYVYVPLLYGKPNQQSTLRGALAFHTNGEWQARPELNGSSRIVKWLQYVTTQVQLNHPTQTIGVIGNCMTGTVPLALLDNPSVTAAVLAQPTPPLPLFYYSHEDKYSLAISESELAKAVTRKDVRIYFVRFETDCVSLPEKKASLKAHFGNRLIDGEITKLEYINPLECNCQRVHSTLIGEWGSRDHIGDASENRREEIRQFLLNPANYEPQRLSYTKKVSSAN